MRRLELPAIFAAHALAFGALVLFACTRCTPAIPAPVTVVTIGDAQIDLCVVSCANEAVFCPSTMSDGGVPQCVAYCHTEAGRTQATTLPSLACMADATSKSAFVACGTVSTCP